MQFVRKAFFALLLMSASSAFAEGVPHYFPAGVEKTNAADLQLDAYFRNINSTSRCTEPGDDTMPILDVPGLRLYEDVVVKGKKVRFLFAPYTKTSDGKIIFSTLCDAKEVTLEQYKFAAKDFISQAILAMEADYQYFKDYGDMAVKARAKHMGISEEELVKQLPLPVPGSPNVTYRERYQLPPEVKETDFIPKEVHVSYIPALGIAYLNSERIYSSLQSRLTDYVSGKPLVLVHEFTHANVNLQNIMLNGGIDLELMASLPEMLLPDDQIHLMFHGYLREIRDIIRIYFGFDFKRVHEEIIKFDPAGHYMIDIPKLIEYQKRLAEIKKELNAFFRDTVVPEFYSDPVYWTSQHDKLQDSRGVFHIMMAMNYDVTLLDGHGPSQKFLSAHRDEFRKMAEKAYKGSGPSNMDNHGASAWAWPIPRITAMRLQEAFGLTTDQVQALAKKYGIEPEDVQGKSLSELMVLANRILSKEFRGRREAIR